MALQARSFVTYRLFADYLWRYKLTTAGKLLIVGGVVCGAMSGSTVQLPVYQLFFPLLMVGVSAWVCGFLCRPKLRIDGDLPRAVTAGSEVTATFRLTNRRRRAAYDISIAATGLPATFRAPTPIRYAALSGGKSVTLSWSFTPTRRGAYVLPPMRAFSTFPFGIVRSGANRQPPRSLLVAPAYHALSALDVPVGRTYQPGGIALTSNIGESTEYIGNREYRPGDPIRRIDSRAWGRLAYPVVKEFQEEYYCRIALVLDTYAGPKRAMDWLRALRPSKKSIATLEAAISLTAAIADALALGEHVVDLFAVGQQLYVFRVGRNLGHLENVLEILACVEASHAHPNDVLMPALADELSGITTSICILLGWDDARRNLVRGIAESGCGLKVIVIADDITDSAFAGESFAADCVALRADDVLAGNVVTL